MKVNYVDTLKQGDSFDSIFLMEDISERETKAQKPYWIVKLTDKTGSIVGKVWDASAWLGDLARRGDYVKIRATVGSYRDKLDLRVEKIRPLSESDTDFSYDDFIPVGPLDRWVVADELQAFAFANIKHPGLAAIVMRLFRDPGLHPLFRDCPAASSNHQPYVGGLVEHVQNMVQVAQFLCDKYKLPQDSRDLLYAACYLHDIGKIRELKWTKGIGYTDEGQLIGHIGLGFEILAEMKTIYWTAIDEGPRIVEGDDWKLLMDRHYNIWNHLRHLIASHHGQLEWRAIALPASREAQLFHLIDRIDSSMGIFDRIDKMEVDEDGFSQFDNRLGTRPWRMPGQE